MRDLKAIVWWCVLAIFPFHLHAQGGGQIGQVQELAPGVYFRQGDIEHKGHCNNAWIVLEDYVVVIDANFPSGAEEVLPQIQRTTSKPIRFVVDTHHHGDHAYGNMIWVRNGVVPVAQENVLTEIHRFEPQRWQEAARTREDVKQLGLLGPKAPTLLFPERLVFDDGKRRLELFYFGKAHPRDHTFAFLPKEKVLFPGDAVVNGPYY